MELDRHSGQPLRYHLKLYAFTNQHRHIRLCYLGRRILCLLKALRWVRAPASIESLHLRDGSVKRWQGRNIVASASLPAHQLNLKSDRRITSHKAQSHNSVIWLCVQPVSVFSCTCSDSPSPAVEFRQTRQSFGDFETQPSANRTRTNCAICHNKIIPAGLYALLRQLIGDWSN